MSRVDTTEENHEVKANTTLFKKEIDSIIKRLEAITRELGGDLKYPSPYPVLGHEMVELYGDITLKEKKEEDEIADIISKHFNVEQKVFLAEYPKSIAEKNVLVANESGITIVFTVYPSIVLYRIYIPALIRENMIAVKGNTSVIYKSLDTVTVKKVLRIGNTLAVPLKRELNYLGNPKRVRVYLDAENRRIIIKAVEEDVLF